MSSWRSRRVVAREARPPARAGRSPGGARCWCGRASRTGASAVCGSPPSRSRRARTRRDLPMPASPDEQDHLALALLGPLPAVEQQRQLLLAADQRRQAGRRAGPRSGPRPRPRRATAKARTGSAKPLRRDRAEVAELEQAAEEPARALGDDHGCPARPAPAAGRPGSASRRPPPARAPPRSPTRSPTTTEPGRDPDPGGERARPRARRCRARPRRRRARRGPRARPRPRAPWASRSRPARRRPCTWRRGPRSARPRRRRRSGRRG